MPNHFGAPNNFDAACIIAGLGGNTGTGMCLCPAHDDKTPSLKVSVGHNGKALVKCFAGCSQDEVLDALRARGLCRQQQQIVAGASDDARHKVPAADEAQDELQRFHHGYKILRAAAKASRSQDIKPGAYLEGRGINIVPPSAIILPKEKAAQYTGRRFPAMVCTIMDDKDILAAHLTFLTQDGTAKVVSARPRQVFGPAKGGYIVCGVANSKKPLIVGEGIETTLAAMLLAGGVPGISAISASNMPSVRPPKCTEIIIAADADDAGRKAAAQLAARLEYEGHKVRIAVPPADGEDWNDRLIASGPEEAREEWEAALAAPDSETVAISALEEREFISLAFPQRELLLGPWLPRPGLVMLHAPRGEGKTWFSLAVAKAVADGRDLLGWPCPNSARVLYVDGELPGASLQARLEKFPNSPPGKLHILCRDTFHLRQQLMPDLGEAEGRRELDRIIEQCQPDVIIFDSISTLVRSGVENEADSWAPLQAWLLQHRWQGRTVILVHHENRTGKPRGTSKREDVLDTMIGLRKVTDESAEEDSTFQLTFTKSRDFYGKDSEPMLVRLSMKEGRVA